LLSLACAISLPLFLTVKHFSFSLSSTPPPSCIRHPFPPVEVWARKQSSPSIPPFSRSKRRHPPLRRGFPLGSLPFPDFLFEKRIDLPSIRACSRFFLVDATLFHPMSQRLCSSLFSVTFFPFGRKWSAFVSDVSPPFW